MTRRIRRSAGGLFVRPTRDPTLHGNFRAAESAVGQCEDVRTSGFCGSVVGRDVVVCPSHTLTNMNLVKAVTTRTRCAYPTVHYQETMEEILHLTLKTVTVTTTENNVLTVPI